MSIDVVTSGLVFPEAPRWHDGRTWYVNGSQVCSVVEGTAPRVHATVATPVCLGLAFAQDGRPLVVAALDRRVHALERDGTVSLFADLSSWLTAPANEIVLSPRGDLYVGGMGFDPTAGDPPAPASLLRIAPDGEISEAAGDLLFPNGMVVSTDGSRLIVAESFAARISMFDISDDGTLANRRLFADLSAVGAHPDGICLDAEGALWYADVRLGAVIRIAEGGEELDRLDLDQAHATSCVLGGSDGRRLYITATQSMPGPEPQQKADGVLLATDVTVPGAGDATPSPLA
jgi:sugar lactone lactonase YvrE